MTGERVIYFVNGSIPSWRALLAAHEKGLEFTPRRLRVMGGRRETRAPDFLAINPRGQAPVLVDVDGAIVPESLAILAYLEACYPAPALLPAATDGPALARALARMHEAEQLACAYEPLEALFVVAPADASPALREALRGALAAVDAELARWEGRVAAAPFLAGDAFTLADCAFYPVLGYLRRRGLSLAAWPHLAAYERRICGRPAAARARPEGWTLGRVGKPNLFDRARAAIGDTAPA